MNVRTFFVGALLVAGALPLAGQVVQRAGGHDRPVAADPANADDLAFEWPTHFRDQPLTHQPLGAIEQRFARRFPGAIARFTDGERVLIVRHVSRPTRQLHPAEDCFRALGYAIGRPRPVVESDGSWSCFIASRDGRDLRVCERIDDREGREWTDASAWFWAAQYGGGPWRALTVVSPVVSPASGGG
jgi:hypothetical protein